MKGLKEGLYTIGTVLVTLTLSILPMELSDMLLRHS